MAASHSFPFSPFLLHIYHRNKRPTPQQRVTYIHSDRAILDEEENKARMPAAEGDRAIVTERSRLLYHQAHLPFLAFIVAGAHLRGGDDGADSSRWCGNDNKTSTPQASTTRPARAVAAAARRNSCCSHQYTLCGQVPSGMCACR